MQEVCENLTIQIMGWKVCLRCKGKTLLGAVNKLLKIKSHVHVCERNYFFAAERKSGVKSLTSEAIPSATQFFMMAYKISHFPGL